MWWIYPETENSCPGLLWKERDEGAARRRGLGTAARGDTGVTQPHRAVLGGGHGHPVHSRAPRVGCAGGARMVWVHVCFSPARVTSRFGQGYLEGKGRARLAELPEQRERERRHAELSGDGVRRRVRGRAPGAEACQGDILDGLDVGFCSGELCHNAF